MITNLDDPHNEIPEPLSKMTEANKKRYITDVKERIRRLMYGLEKDKHVIHSRLMNEFENFEAKERESLYSVYERLSTLVNVKDHNDVCPIKLSINTKFLNSLQPEWSKYPHVQASKAKRAIKNHDPLALIAHSSQSHASSSYSHSPQPYYATHPLSIVDSKEDYERELQGDAQEDMLIRAMMLLARAITQKFSTPTNNRFHTSSNTWNQAVIHDGRVDIQTKNAGYSGNGNKNAGIRNRNQAANAKNGPVQQIDESHYARDCPKPKGHHAKYFREQMLLAMKDESGGTLNEEENDFMLDNAYGDERLEELTATVIMMAQIQPADDNAETEPKYDAEAVSEVNASQIDLISSMISKGFHEHTNHEKLKTVINTSDNDQIDCNIIFDDPYMENNGGTVKHDSNAYGQSFDIESLAYNVQREAENQQRLNIKLKKQKELLQKELETFYDPFLKAGLGYQNLERLKKAIATQPKMYEGERLHCTTLSIDSSNSEETLEDLK
ncbi:hypothetical protein Tco_0545710, partial [Tanacetum coccineum]